MGPETTHFLNTMGSMIKKRRRKIPCNPSYMHTIDMIWLLSSTKDYHCIHKDKRIKIEHRSFSVITIIVMKLTSARFKKIFYITFIPLLLISFKNTHTYFPYFIRFFFFYFFSKTFSIFMLFYYNYTLFNSFSRCQSIVHECVRVHYRDFDDVHKSEYISRW